jgi:hypothetical protein
MKAMVFWVPMGSSSSNFIATSQKQPAHVNWYGGAFREVSDGLEEEEEEGGDDSPMRLLLPLLVPSRCHPSPLVVTLHSSPLTVPVHASPPLSPCSCCCCRHLPHPPLACVCPTPAPAPAAWLSFSQAWSHPHFVSCMVCSVLIYSC